MMLKPLFLLIGFFFCFISHSAPAAAFIPAKHDGFWYINRPVKAGSVLIEAFIDPVCPDSRDAWKPLKLAVDHYGSRVSLVLHTFSLPYHDNSFGCSRALHIVDKLNPSATYPLLEAFFEQQEKFYGGATANLTRISVREEIVKFAAKTIGNSYFSAVEQGFNDTRTDQATRIAFKYGCLRGVYGTPFFFVNGFPLDTTNSPAMDYKAWRTTIDPLVTARPQKDNPVHALHFF